MKTTAVAVAVVGYAAAPATALSLSPAPVPSGYFQRVQECQHLQQSQELLPSHCNMLVAGGGPNATTQKPIDGLPEGVTPVFRGSPAVQVPLPDVAVTKLATNKSSSTPEPVKLENGGGVEHARTRPQVLPETIRRVEDYAMLSEDSVWHACNEYPLEVPEDELWASKEPLHASKDIFQRRTLPRSKAVELMQARVEELSAEAGGDDALDDEVRAVLEADEITFRKMCRDRADAGGPTNLPLGDAAVEDVAERDSGLERQWRVELLAAGSGDEPAKEGDDGWISLQDFRKRKAEELVQSAEEKLQTSPAPKFGTEIHDLTEEQRTLRWEAARDLQDSLLLHYENPKAHVMLGSLGLDETNQYRVPAFGRSSTVFDLPMSFEEVQIHLRALMLLHVGKKEKTSFAVFLSFLHASGVQDIDSLFGPKPPREQFLEAKHGLERVREWLEEAEQFPLSEILPDREGDIRDWSTKSISSGKKHSAPQGRATVARTQRISASLDLFQKAWDCIANATMQFLSLWKSDDPSRV